MFLAWKFGRWFLSAFVGIGVLGMHVYALPFEYSIDHVEGGVKGLKLVKEKEEGNGSG